MPNNEMDDIVIPESLPMLPVRDVVVFPYMVLPLYVGREQSIKAVNQAYEKNRLIFLASQKNIGDDAPQPESIFEVGTVAIIMRMKKLPDGRIKILAQGISKAKVKTYEQSVPFYQVQIEKCHEETKIPQTPEEQALMNLVRSQLEKLISLGKMLSPDILMVVNEITDMGRLADLVASNIGLKVTESQEILETFDGEQRLVRVSNILAAELDQLTQAQKNNTKDEEKVRRDFMRDQMRNMRNENPDDPKAEELNEIRAKIERASMSTEAYDEAMKQLGRLERMHPDASEASIVRTYLDWLCDLPWSKGTEDQLDIRVARKFLDEDHFGLDKVKDRILEFLAVRKLRKENKGPILCLGGPPGVGKTSLGRSIARAMGRKFVRISLGGVHDEAEIRGHRRTYVGAMPGRIIQAMKTAGSNNPVIMLDEIDKLGQDYKGDPSSALLEVLDPEQNNTFRDHYLNLPFNLSNVMFIANANALDRIPQALRDRMEVIELSGYTEEDKLRIAKEYLVTKQIEENGLTAAAIDFNEEALKKIIAEYTREAGLRNFERLIGTCCRKVAKEVASWDGAAEFPKITVDTEKVEKYLGAPRYVREDKKDEDEVGAVTGLAWTQFGGEVLEVEVTSMPGKGGFVFTGSLGDVMRESCQAASSWIRANSVELDIDPEFFSKNEIHVHFPSGATPKDGPSAGITITTALVSMLKGIPVSKDVAMTGEISILGKVLPIGGLKDKSLAAKRHGIKKVVIPYKNQKDLAEIPEEYVKGLEFVAAKNISEVLKVALVRNPFKTLKKVVGGGRNGGGSGSSGGHKNPSAAKSRKTENGLEEAA